MYLASKSQPFLSASIETSGKVIGLASEQRLEHLQQLKDMDCGQRL